MVEVEEAVGLVDMAGGAVGVGGRVMVTAVTVPAPSGSPVSSSVFKSS